MKILTPQQQQVLVKVRAAIENLNFNTLLSTNRLTLSNGQKSSALDITFETLQLFLQSDQPKLSGLTPRDVFNLILNKAKITLMVLLKSE